MRIIFESCLARRFIPQVLPRASFLAWLEPFHRTRDDPLQTLLLFVTILTRMTGPPRSVRKGDPCFEHGLPGSTRSPRSSPAILQGPSTLTVEHEIWDMISGLSGGRIEEQANLEWIL